MVIDLSKEELTLEWIKNNLTTLINNHSAQRKEIKKMYEYVKGDHDILHRVMSDLSIANNKLVCNFPKYISTVSVGYFMGNPISYQSTKAGQKSKVDKLKKIFKRSDAEAVDIDISMDSSIAGVGYEIIKAFEDHNGELIPKSYSLHPENTVVIYDNTVEETPLMGIYYVDKREQGTLFISGFAIVVTEDKIYKFKGGRGSYQLDGTPTDHYFGVVPIIEYKNNALKQGDFQPVITLIDAYNLLQSDRVNDKEQLIDAILMIKGVDLRDPDIVQNIKDQRILVLPTDGNAAWLTKQLDEADTDVLQKLLEENIHKFSLTPNITDDQFSGNASGVAMQYKLFGFEQLIKTKERFFQESLRWRILAYLNFLSHTGYLNGLSVDDIEFIFNRNLPTNNIEIAQMVSQLATIISRETLLGQVPFVKDTDIELDRIKKEEKQKADTLKDNFGFPKEGEELNENRNKDNKDEGDIRKG